MSTSYIQHTGTRFFNSAGDELNFSHCEYFIRSTPDGLNTITITTLITSVSMTPEGTRITIPARMDPQT